MKSRDFLARIEGLKIQIKPDIMGEVNRELSLWPEELVDAYLSDLLQVVSERTQPYLDRAIDRMNTGEKPDQQDKRLADAVSYLALAILRVYQIKREDDQAQA